MDDRGLKSNPMFKLVDEVARLQGRFKSLFAGVHSVSGLRPMEELVLTAIVEAEAAPTVPRIGRSLGHPRQVIQRAVDDMAAEGYIDKLPNPDHKRASLLTITPRGRRLKERSDAHAIAIANAVLGGVDARRFESLAVELQAVRKALEAFSRRETDST